MLRQNITKNKDTVDIVDPLESDVRVIFKINKRFKRYKSQTKSHHILRLSGGPDTNFFIQFWELSHYVIVNISLDVPIFTAFRKHVPAVRFKQIKIVIFSTAINNECRKIKKTSSSSSSSSNWR